MSMSECAQSSDGRDWSGKAINSNFSFGSTIDVMGGKSRLSSSVPVAYQNGVYGTTPTTDTCQASLGKNDDSNVSEHVVPKRRKTENESDNNDKGKFQYLNNGFCIESTNSIAAL